MKRTKLADRTLFWDYNGQMAARSGEWKLIINHSEGLGSPLVKERWLSNLGADPGETKNSAADKPEAAARLADAISTSRAQYP